MAPYVMIEGGVQAGAGAPLRQTPPERRVIGISARTPPPFDDDRFGIGSPPSPPRSAANYDPRLILPAPRRAVRPLRPPRRAGRAPDGTPARPVVPPLGERGWRERPGARRGSRRRRSSTRGPNPPGSRR